ncbi:MAG TPA: MGMT family protein, partial [Euryarchaeota archaeon]|nr:MGMT family protein [Euryarchaeota archaeon]
MQKIFSYLGFEVLVRFSKGRLVRVELTGRRSNATELPDFKPGLSTFGHFDSSVMKAAMKIPVGRVTTYMALADAAGRQKAARAAGNVMAKNPY